MTASNPPPLVVGDRPYLVHRSLGPKCLHPKPEFNPLSRFAGFRRVTDRQTDRQTDTPRYEITDRISPHLVHSVRSENEYINRIGWNNLSNWVLHSSYREANTRGSRGPKTEEPLHSATRCSLRLRAPQTSSSTTFFQLITVRRANFYGSFHYNFHF